jgi:trehalose-6-phosphate synthase
MDRYAGTATRSIELDDDSPLGTPERRRSLTESLGLAYSVSEENSTARVPSVEEQQLLDKIAEIQKKLDVSRAERIRIGEEEEHKTQVSHMAGRRLIMVSNRLPVSISKDKEGKWVFKMSSGGLVTALSGLKKEVPFLWVGWVGMSVPESERPILAQRLENELGLYPVFLPEDLVHKYYNGFCNDILWPLFHYTPLPDFEPGRDMKFDMGLWEAYLAANEAFTRVTLEAYKPGDLVWVHDYHLMVMPSQLRKSVPDMKIGWFLHTPFPALDMYRILPVRTEIMEGVLLADLVGFHTQDYARKSLRISENLMK